MSRFNVPPPPLPRAAVAPVGQPRAPAQLAWDEGFLQRTYATLWILGPLAALCCYGLFRSSLALESFMGGLALGAMLLKSQELLVRRLLVQPASVAGDKLRLLTLVLLLPLKYGAVALGLWLLTGHHLLHIPSLLAGLLMVHVAITSRAVGQLLMMPHRRLDRTSRSSGSRLLGASLMLCLMLAGAAFNSPAAHAQTEVAPGVPAASAPGQVGAPAGGSAKAEAPPNPFAAEHGTWLNPLVRRVFGQGPVEKNKKGEFTNVQYDFIVIAVLTMLGLGVAGVTAARRAKLRPEGKPNSLPNLVEAAVDGYQQYLVGVLGPDLAGKYGSLISSYFFTILCFNWLGLVPGLVAPTANPNVPIALGISAFVCVHFIAIREAGFKNWFMHLVGEPRWLFFLNFPLHVVGEFIKPISLTIRLLCNVFAEEMVSAQLALLAVGAMMVLHVPIPFQFPMLVLGAFFGLIQALVFSTLLAIYIQILATHEDEGHHAPQHLEAHPAHSALA